MVLSFNIGNFETYARYSWVADEEQKKGLRCIFISNLKTYTRFSWVADKNQKKKVIGVLNGSIVGGGNSLLNFFKGGNLKKKCLGNPDI